MIDFPFIARSEIFPLTELKKVADLIYFDGPLLSELISPKGDVYIAYWCDTDQENLNRWMYLRASENDLMRLKLRQLPLGQIIPNGAQDEFVYLVDVDRDNKCQVCSLTRKSDVPAEYQPAQNVFLAETVIQSNHGAGLVPFPISGQWGFKEWKAFPSELRLLYATSAQYQKHNVVSTLPVVHNGEQFPSFKWRYQGGFSEGHFGNWLIAQLEQTEKPEIKRLKYASPGYIEFAVNIDYISQALRWLAVYSVDHKTIDFQDQLLKDYFRSNKLDVMRDKLDPAMYGEEWLPHFRELERLANDLWQSLSLVEVGRQFKAYTANQYDWAHLSRWFIRRLAKLRKFESDDLVDFPDLG